MDNEWPMRMRDVEWYVEEFEKRGENITANESPQNMRITDERKGRRSETME